MYHRTAIDESGEFLIEVLNYCYQKMLKQVNLAIKNKKNKKVEKNKLSL